MSDELLDRELMALALEQARTSLAAGGVPVGAVLAAGGEVLGAGHNERVQHGDPVAHGEISALRKAGRRPSYAGTALYTTLSPCQLCTGAVLLFQIPRVVVGEARTFEGDLGFLRSRGVDVRLLDDPECVAVMEEFQARYPEVWSEDIGGRLPSGGDASRRTCTRAQGGRLTSGSHFMVRHRMDGLLLSSRLSRCVPSPPRRINSPFVSSEVSAEVSRRFPDVAALAAALDKTGYMAGDQLAAALFLSVRMGQPILLEGEPGVGKTQAAKSLAEALDTVLVRLQCYEGISAAEALYEWNYPKQLLAIRLAEATHETLRETDLFQEDFLLSRPLLTALDYPGPRPAVLLIDEVDRADDEFEAFLFEMLAESSVTIPELGTRHAVVPPVVILTSNRTRDLHDALKRRCLYHWIGFPDAARVASIIRRRVPAASEVLSGEVAAAVARLRSLGLTKPPGISEAITWAGALTVFGAEGLSAAAVERTMSVVVKYPEDEQAVRDAGLAAIVGRDLPAR